MLLPTHGSAFHLKTPPARHSPDPQPSRLAVPIPPLPPHFAQPPPSSNIDLPPKCVTLTTDPHNSAVIHQPRNSWPPRPDAPNDITRPLP
ncbi:hypothetical protein TGCAST_389360, partial [Toxoplasma gondii CAST]